MGNYSQGIIRDAWVEIDRARLKDNFMAVRRAVGENVKICAVLKSQCYGLDCRMTAALFRESGAYMYAVAVLSEALEVRQACPGHDILILGYLSEEHYPPALDRDISLTMYRWDMIEAFSAEACRRSKKGKIHIKVNTGMNRLGFMPDEASADIVARAAGLPGIEIGGVYTHFAAADEADKGATRKQAERFAAFIDMLKARGVPYGLIHAANSPSLCDLPEYDFDMVRPGLLFTGTYPSAEVSRERIRVKPAVRLMGRLGSVAPIPAGEAVGYGFSHRLEKDTLVGVLPLGYADGFTRCYSNNFYVMVRGKRCPVIGRICMDHCMIDLSAVPDAAMGDEIIVYGNGDDGALTIEEAAGIRGTVVEEVLSNLSPRLPRVLIGG
ncbi:MAG: alanine racemase [Clostridiales bacterium]|nr:alanine racemase [Clostridiales bacterium]